MAIDLARIENWLCRRALPLWTTVGWDEVHGGFHDRIARADGTAVLVGDDGSPMPKRARVQARQIYVYSHAAMIGLDEKARDRAAAGFAFLTGHYWHKSGGWIYSCGRDGQPLVSDRDLYEQAFALFSLAWYFRVSGDASALEWAVRTAAFLDESKLDTDHGGYWDEKTGALPRCQNPHMHLLEAWLALYAATGEQVWLDRATTIIELFERSFFDEKSATLGEFFDWTWAPAAGVTGQIIEPGHHYEWVWLLAQYSAASGRDMDQLGERLYNFAGTYGIDSDGLVFDAVLRDGTLHDDKKRLWVQTEALKAATARYEATGDMATARRVDGLLGQLFGHYLDEANGGYEEHLSRDRMGLKDFAPASSFYHVFLALAEILRVFGANGE